MTKQPPRKYIKTKFEGVFYRLSARRDPRTGELDKIYCFWFTDELGRGHWKTVGRHSKGIRPAVARNRRAEFLAQRCNGLNPVIQEKVTVGEAVEAYVFWARNENKHINQPLQQYEKHMRKRLHAIPITSITPGLLSSIKAELEKTPVELKTSAKNKDFYDRSLSAQTITHLFSFLRSAVNRALATNLWYGNNPFSSRKGGAWKMPKVDNRRQRFFTPVEARMLLDDLAKRSRQLHDMAFLSLKTGLRATEIFSLRGNDIDEFHNILHITSKGGRKAQVQTTPDVIAMLLEYERSGGEHIFQERGTGGRIKRISDAFESAIRELGLDTSQGDSRFAVTFHTLRHTFASWLAQSGNVSLWQLQKMMRHESITMTQRYALLMPGQEREKLLIIDDMLRHSLKK